MDKNLLTAEVYLGYFKQGDDLAAFFRQCNDPVKALRMHSAMLLESVNTLNRLIDEIEKSGQNVEICADTHYIGITASEDLISKLDELGLIEINVEDMDDYLENEFDDEDTELESNYDYNSDGEIWLADQGDENDI